MMRDALLSCPLCCNNVFNTKHELVEHLANIFANISCPICQTKLSSLELLIQHFNLNKCNTKETVETIVFDNNIQNEIDEENKKTFIEKVEQTYIENPNEKGDTEDQFLSYENPDSEDVVEESSEVGKMYVELLSKQLMKPCLQTQELKLVKEDGESRYMILDVTKDDFILKTDSTVVTKQNSDGTISLTTVRDPKTGEDSILPTPSNETEESQEEIYSCNTCGVSFTSVIEHIQNYHNDQDVVVEDQTSSQEPIEAMEESNDQEPIRFDTFETEENLTDDKQASRRVITDTGDIVETPLIIKSTVEIKNETIPNNIDNDDDIDNGLLKEVEKRGRGQTRRYVQIDKYFDSVVKEIKNTDEKKGPYHKVLVKEMQTLDGGSKMKVYNCMSCNIYVATLDDFKSHPCKTLKYSCPHCPVAYENSKSLCAHMKVHKVNTETDNDNSNGPFKCETCSTIFPTNKSLKLHKRMHDPIKSRPIEPPTEIVDGVEVSNGQFVCEICHKLIPIDYRTVHQNSHKNVNKYNCDICNRKFHSNEYLEMHMSVHNLDKAPVNKQDKTLPYTCLYCSRQFARPHEKVKHERIHTGEKPHRCEICGKSFRVSYCLTLHMRTHTGARPYACPHCGKRFKAHSVYNHHLLTHSEVRAYKCPYCPKAFKTSVQLAGHKNSHTKPFSCQHCNRPFASLYAVRVHTETHARQNNLKFSCSLCGASYARTFALKDHIKQVHKQDVENIDNLADIKDESWMITDTDPDAIQNLNKDLPEEVQ